MRFTVVLLLAVLSLGAQQTPHPGKGRGSVSAPILVEVFSDFQCAACKSFYEQTIRPMITEYVSTGKVYLVHRDFPLPMHQYAREAAIYASAAARIGKYHQVSDALFEKQADWTNTGRPGDVAIGALSTIDAQKLRGLVKSPDVAAEVDKDIQLGRDARVNQTPTMIVTHNMRRYPVSGMVTFPIVKRFLDQLLGK